MSESGSEPREGLTALAELAPARGNLYRFLSSAFSEPPSAALLENLADPGFADSLGKLLDEAIANDLRAGAGTGDEPVATLRQAFMNLFKAPGGQYVHPYESVYRDTREINGQPVGGLLMGPAAAAVQQWYRLAALEISPEFKDLPDHVSLEFHYLAHLCDKEQEFDQAGDSDKTRRAREMERDFLKAHILTWVPDLAAKIQERTEAAYFRAVAALATEFSRRDLDTLEVVLGPSQGAETPAYEH